MLGCPRGRLVAVTVLLVLAQLVFLVSVLSSLYRLKDKEKDRIVPRVRNGKLGLKGYTGHARIGQARAGDPGTLSDPRRDRGSDSDPDPESHGPDVEAERTAGHQKENPQDGKLGLRERRPQDRIGQSGLPVQDWSSSDRDPIVPPARPAPASDSDSNSDLVRQVPDAKVSRSAQGAKAGNRGAEPRAINSHQAQRMQKTGFPHSESTEHGQIRNTGPGLGTGAGRDVVRERPERPPGARSQPVTQSREGLPHSEPIEGGELPKSELGFGIVTGPEVVRERPEPPPGARSQPVSGSFTGGELPKSELGFGIDTGPEVIRERPEPPPGARSQPVSGSFEGGELPKSELGFGIGTGPEVAQERPETPPGTRSQSREGLPHSESVEGGELPNRSPGLGSRPRPDGKELTAAGSGSWPTGSSLGPGSTSTRAYPAPRAYGRPIVPLMPPARDVVMSEQRPPGLPSVPGGLPLVPGGLSSGAYPAPRAPMRPSVPPTAPVGAAVSWEDGGPAGPGGRITHVVAPTQTSAPVFPGQREPERHRSRRDTSKDQLQAPEGGRAQDAGAGPDSDSDPPAEGGPARGQQGAGPEHWLEDPETEDIREGRHHVPRRDSDPGSDPEPGSAARPGPSSGLVEAGDGWPAQPQRPGQSQDDWLEQAEPELQSGEAEPPPGAGPLSDSDPDPGPPGLAGPPLSAASPLTSSPIITNTTTTTTTTTSSSSSSSLSWSPQAHQADVPAPRFGLGPRPNPNLNPALDASASTRRGPPPSSPTPTPTLPPTPSAAPAVGPASIPAATPTQECCCNASLPDLMRDRLPAAAFRPARYFMYLPYAGATNQLLCLLKAAHLARTLNRTLILPTFLPSQHEIPPAHGCWQALFRPIPFQSYFDLESMLAAFNVSYVHLHSIVPYLTPDVGAQDPDPVLTQPASNISDVPLYTVAPPRPALAPAPAPAPAPALTQTLTPTPAGGGHVVCRHWDRNSDKMGLGARRIIGYYSLDVRWARVPSRRHALHPASDLGSDLDPDLAGPAEGSLEPGRPDWPDRPFGPGPRPGPQVLCVKNVFFMGGAPVAEMLRALRFSPLVEAYAQRFIEREFQGRPFAAVHVRRSDKTTGRDLARIARSNDRIHARLLAEIEVANQGLLRGRSQSRSRSAQVSPADVFVATDERDPVELEGMRSMGWRRWPSWGSAGDASRDGSGESRDGSGESRDRHGGSRDDVDNEDADIQRELGLHGRLVVDGAVMARAHVLLADVDSTVSYVAAVRVREWMGGHVAFLPAAAKCLRSKSC